MTRVSIPTRFRAIFDSITGEWRALQEPRLPCEQIATELKAASLPTTTFFVLLSLSCAIATFGLLANSAPAIIGAMIIAPLMTPIMALSYGVVQASWSQIIRSAITIFLGVALVITISFLSAGLIEIKVAGTEMLSRAFPSMLDLGVAMAAGAAGAFALSRESIKNSVAGVAISVSLVPPLAVAGIGLAVGRKATADIGLSFREVGLLSGGIDIALGATVLFLTNLAAIVVVAGIVMMIQGYARWKRGFFGLACAVTVSMILVQPLAEHFQQLRVKSMALRLVKTLAITHPDFFEQSLRLDTLRVRTENNMLHVRAEGSVARNKLAYLPARLDLFRRELEEQVGEPVVIEVEAVAVDTVRLRSAPDEAEDQVTP